MAVGEKIKQIRKAKGMTQKQLAQVTGIDDATIRKYESGKLNPKTITLEKIADGLGVDISNLTEDTIDISKNDSDIPKAMYRIFSFINSCSGDLLSGEQIKTDIKNGCFDENRYYISIDFSGNYIQSWHQQYNEYKEIVKETEMIEDEELKSYYKLTAKVIFDRWMLQYPDSGSNQALSCFRKVLNGAADYRLNLHIEDDKLSPKQKSKLKQKLEISFVNLLQLQYPDIRRLLGLKPDTNIKDFDI